MKVIDGAQGEGGGQIFRTSLTLAMCLDKSVTIKNIRAGRKKPGLLRQHLTCLNAAQMISGAEVVGAELGSQTVEFTPGKVKSGRYQFAVGSAGSTTLVFQTIYLPLLLAGGESELLLEGGTHNGMAPSFDFLQQSFLPELKKMGIHMDMTLEKYGFYPAGGGAWSARIYPVKTIQAYKNTQRGEFHSINCTATSAQISSHVVGRELSRVEECLALPKENLNKRLVRSVGPGNILSLQAASENITEVIDIVGERGMSAEVVADKALAILNRYLTSSAVMGEYLADQLLLPMALGSGGSFTTLESSMHLKTNAAVIEAFFLPHISIDKGDDSWLVDVPCKNDKMHSFLATR